MLHIEVHSEYSLFFFNHACSCAGVCVHASDTWNDSCQLCADCLFNGFKCLNCSAPSMSLSFEVLPVSLATQVHDSSTSHSWAQAHETVHIKGGAQVKARVLT